MSLNANNKLLEHILSERKKKAQNLLRDYGDAWLIITYGKHDDNFEYLTGVHTYGLSAAVLTKDKLIVLVSRLEKSFVENKHHIDDIIDFYGFRDFEHKLQRIFNDLKGSTILANIASQEICFHASKLEYNLARKAMFLAEIYESLVKPAGRFVRELRTTKTNSELNALEYSVKITLDILDSIKNKIKPGITERELMALLYYETYKYGEPSFEPIVASGPNTANPHHISSERKIRDNDIIYIDFGVKTFTMSADITRAYVIGNVPQKIINVYKAVHKAQNAAIDAFRVGVPYSEPDHIARQVFADLGYDPKKYFTHSLGHALGVDVHDVGPPLYEQITDYKIIPSIAYTVEPALYLFDEDPVFGIRIEDDVILTSDGKLKRLSFAPEEPESIY